MTLRLGGTTAVIGPARDVDPDELAEVSCLQRLAAPRGGSSPIGVASCVADEHVDLPGPGRGGPGRRAAAVARLRESCPPADVEESALLRLDPVFVLVDDGVPAVARRLGYLELGIQTTVVLRGA